MNYILRSLCGLLLLDVYLSPWVFACTGLLALYLALAKRYYEKSVFKDHSTEFRPVFKKYKHTHLRNAHILAGVLLVCVYFMYTVMSTHPYIYLSCIPFVFFIWTFTRRTLSKKPVAGNLERLLFDVHLLLSFVLTAAISLLSIYGKAIFS
jgi:hypothetical protein